MYQLRSPHADLFPFIEHYWFVTSADGPVDLRVEVFVDARARLLTIARSRGDSVKFAGEDRVAGR